MRAKLVLRDKTVYGDGWIVQVVDGLAAHGEDGNAAVEATVRDEVQALCARFPLYAGM